MYDRIPKIITPLRVGAILFFILFISTSIEIWESEKAGHETGLGGLAPLVLGFFTLACVIIDFVLSKKLKTKTNWIIQSFLTIVFLTWAYIN